MKIKKGDTVKVISGKYKGKQGQVMLVIPQRNKIVVKGINLVTKNKKETKDAKNPGGRIKIESPLNVSNVMLVSPHSGKPIRISYKLDPKTNKKSRFSKKDNKAI